MCEFEINECLSEPCHNGGTCTDQLAGFTCECSEEYTGQQCDVLRLVTCENNPCKIGSQCLNGYSKHVLFKKLTTIKSCDFFQTQQRATTLLVLARPDFKGSFVISHFVQ